MAKEIRLQGTGWQMGITLAGLGVGMITSDLKRSYTEGEPVDDVDIAFDAVESMVLAHACAGLNVEDPRYIEGLDTAIQAISNNLT